MTEHLKIIMCLYIYVSCNALILSQMFWP